MADPHDWRGSHGAWRGLEPTSERRNGYVVWKGICGLCQRLLTVRSDVLAKGSTCCASCAQKRNGVNRHDYGGACEICGEAKTAPRYCSEACRLEANRRRARAWHQANRSWLNKQRRELYIPRDSVSRGEAHSIAVAAGKARVRSLASAYDALVDALMADARIAACERAENSLNPSSATRRLNVSSFTAASHAPASLS